MDAIVLDVNHFHMLNERYGKQYGDSVLARIGRQVRQISREVGGVACRRGADTFYIYCPHREEYESILDKASEGLVDEDVSANRVRLRMGVYSQVDKSLQIERRFDYAKIAANTVRNGYRKAIGIYDTEMHEAELYRERLLEDNGLILDLDQFVWREAAARIRDWKDRFGYSVPVSVNVSRIDMLTPNLKSISKALTSDFESIFYVDVVTDFYLEFFTGKGGDLEIRPGGADFFDAAREKLLEDVSEADAQRVREATSKANLINLAEQEEAVTLSFHKRKNGAEKPYVLQTIRTRESDNHHIVIGVRQE